MIYQAKDGQHLKGFVNELQEVSKKEGKAVVGKFNNILLEVTQDKPYEKIIFEYDMQLFKRRGNWETSKEKKMYEEKKQKENLEKQKEVDELMNQFVALQKLDYRKTLDWLIKIQPYTENKHVDFDAEKIVRDLIDVGYKDTSNPEDLLNESSEDVARHIIEQAVTTLRSVKRNILESTKMLAEEWLNKQRVTH